MEKLRSAGENRGDEILRIPAVLMNDICQSFSGWGVLMSLHRPGDMKPTTPKGCQIDLDRFSSQKRDTCG